MTQTIEKFIRKHSISATADRVSRNPHMAHMGDGARHWEVMLCRAPDSGRGSGEFLTVPFSQGSAHTEPPTAADVLTCLADDTHTIEQAGSFEDWCDELGFDSDSRSAERTYNVCREQAERVRAWLGDDRTEELLYQTGRE